jgi:hypothetical protein
MSIAPRQYGSEAAVGVGADGRAPSMVNALESGPPRRRDALTWRRSCRRPKDGKAATPRPGASPDITPLPGARQHPDGCKQVGVLGLYQRPLAVKDSRKQAPCRAEVVVAFPPKRDSYALRHEQSELLLAGGRRSAEPVASSGARPARETSVMRDHSVDDPVLARLFRRQRPG